MDGELQNKVPAYRRLKELGYKIIYAHYTGIPIRESAPYYILGKTSIRWFKMNPLYIDLLKLTPILDFAKFFKVRMFQYSFLKDPFDAVKQIPENLNQPFPGVGYHPGLFGNK